MSQRCQTQPFFPENRNSAGYPGSFRARYEKATLRSVDLAQLQAAVAGCAFRRLQQSLKQVFEFARR